MSQDTELAVLTQWQRQGYLRLLDLEFARLVADHARNQHGLPTLAALVSHQLSAGNVCLPLAYLKESSHWPAELVAPLSALGEKVWQPDGVVLSDGSQPSLLVLDEGRVYLYRYWHYEVEVSKAILQRAQPLACDMGLLQKGLGELFPAGDETPDWQKVAAGLSLQHAFTVISGGPGTGKTTTVTKILALYIQQQLAAGLSPQIRLAAPTGKAAARLSDSIARAKNALHLSEQVRALIPEDASTLHRLLGVQQGTIEFKHNRHNPLALDLLLVDEASMIDLPMMYRLLQAMPPQGRLILLGDRDQLASVEAGSVLGDICAWPQTLAYSSAQTDLLNRLCRLEPGSALQADEKNNVLIRDCLSLLWKSYRFSAGSGIGRLAQAVNLGDLEGVLELISDPPEDLTLATLGEQQLSQLLERVIEFHVHLLSDDLSTGPEVFLDRLEQLQVLCALREGPLGVSGLNQRIREGLVSRGVIRGDHLWYRGRPVMITRNDARLGLYNGDIGVVWPDAEGNSKVWFPQAQGLTGFLPSRLPEHETVYAMTVHKSQGSEFDHVVLVIPAEAPDILTRELLYTGITRAKKQLSLIANRVSLERATSQPVLRWGGLADRLWNQAE
ncbi:exodeoxyribonuclease V subunit alpha [Neptuniibacter sp. CAU 1671]|uniref:exodeoxyribonuclease V subunit alpha n=1 Tax=Neptuniibacter sp. CAU 1671 TaxID=3032593 RepID=UPI0023DC7001|nr:exodeoxyribonuclease V subunit alpha [Neptuniibacter sp. CAU 1671]MDF2181996.1 exodeoxyribonuclease V subunit alpha [Neptuniibacter sp. CAU 1671]